MQIIRSGVLLLALVFSAATIADTIEVEVHGLTCAFCVDSLQRQLKKLPDIETVDVSLKSRLIRIVASTEHVDRARIRETVIDAGFTPMTIRTIEDEG